MSYTQAISSYVDQNQDRFLEELFSLLKIQSVSADSKFKVEVLKAADFLKQRLEELDLDHVEICETDGYPIVYGEKIIDPNLPTLLVYGHYDVQPADPYDLWTSPPFEPQVRNGKIYARGSSDDKGQMYMHIKAYESVINAGEIPCNIKFMIEGEEEIGSDNLERFVRNNKQKLAADVMLISDTSIVSMETPSITTGLRGLAYMEVEVTGPSRDLHSGTFGGAVANPINTLCKMIASLKDDQGRITIPGFYDKVVALSDEERQALAKVPFSLDAYKKSLGIDDIEGEEGFTTLERIGTRPTLDVNGIWGGYTGEGAKTVLPSKAYAKISMRLVPHQNHKEIANLFQKHFESIAPKSVKVKVNTHHGGQGVVIPFDSKEFQAGSKAFEKVWGKAAIPIRDGGSIPIVSLFQDELKLNCVLMGFGLDDDAIHSPNESYGVENYLKGIKTIAAFYEEYTRLKIGDK